MTRQISDCRSAAIEVLELLSSANRQLDYEKKVPRISVCNELVSMWFDDFYLPHSESFRKSFSPKELEALEAFHHYFDEYEKLLPKSPTRIADWIENEKWQGIMREAGRVLIMLREV